MTSWAGFAVARARASWGLLLTLLALVTVTTGIIAGTVGYSQAAATAAARGALAQGEPTESGIQAQTRISDDPRAQDRLAHEAITRAFAPAPVSVARVVVSEPQRVQSEGTELDGRVVLMGGPALTGGPADGAEPADGGEGSNRADGGVGAAGLEELVTVVEGAWPPAGTSEGEGATGGGGTSEGDGATADGSGGSDGSDTPAPGALHVGAAQAWGVGVGDVLVLADRSVEVVATWTPVDAQAAFWFGDELVRTGVVEADHGPLLVDEELVEQVGVPFVRWTVQPDPSTLDPDDLATLADSAERLHGDLRRAAGVNVRGVLVEGDLAPTAAAAATNLATARALGVVPLSVLVLVTGLAVVQLARLLASTREPQVQLLVARGAARRQVLAAGLAESVAVAVLGALLGAALGWGVLRLVPGGDLPEVTRTMLTTAALALLGILLVLAAVAALQARRLAGGQAVGDRSGRARAATALATVVLVLGAAALTWWQLRRAGSPLVRNEDGELGTDLVAGAAPALLLAAAAVVALALLGPLSRAVELTTRSSRSVTGHLASAQVSRRLSVYAVPVVLTVLAVGATTLSALYAGTSSRLRDDLSAVSEGAPLRADLDRPIVRDEPGVFPPSPPELDALPEVDRSALVWLEPDARLGDVTVPLTMAETTQLDAVAADVGGTSLIPGGLGELVDTTGATLSSRAIEIPAGTRELTFALTTEMGIGPWEQARLDGLADSERELSRLMEIQEIENPPELGPGDTPPPEMTFEETMRLVLGNEVERARSPQPVGVALLLRDTETGMSYAVEAGSMDAQGPELAFDAETFSDVTATPATSTGELRLELPEGRHYALDAVTVALPPESEGFWDLSQRTFSLELTLAADGTDLLTGASGWGSHEAATPEQAAPAQEKADAVDDPYFRQVVEPYPDGSFTTSTDTNQVQVPAALDASASPWRLTGTLTMLPEDARSPFDLTLAPATVIAPGASYTGSVGGTVEDIISAGGPGGPGAPAGDEEAGTDLAVPVAMTRAAADAAALVVGDTFELAFSGIALPARLTTVVPAVPGQTGTVAALADSRAVARAFASQQRAMPWPTQAWATPVGDAGPAVAALSAREDLVAVTGPVTVSVADATSAARLVFRVASAGAVLLALTGIAAVAATLLSARRPEVAVLRALGMPPAAQARSRALELGGVVLAAVAFGLAAGWAVGAGVVPELASSTTQPGGLTLPATLRLETAPWAVLVGAGGVLVLGLALLLAARVRAQALDRGYREEIR